MFHPAITRGRFDVRTARVATVSADGQDLGTVPVGLILRVVVASHSLRPLLEAAASPAGTGPQELTTDAFLQVVAPFLREGLIDPGNGRANRWLPPVQLVETAEGMAFVQPVAGLN
jgi:hypothetical protein